MIRTTLIALAALIAAPAYAQITFRASSLDIEQNKRLDDVESRVESIEQSVGRIEGAVTQMLSDQTMALAVKPKPEPKAKPEPTIRESRKVQPTARISTNAEFQAKLDRNRYTTAELKEAIDRLRPYREEDWTDEGEWVPGRYDSRGSLVIRHADVSPRSAARRHLTSSIHGFTASQVNGLSQEEVVILHDLEHGGEITPYRNMTVHGTPKQEPKIELMRSVGCANGQCARQSTGTIKRSRFFSRILRR